MEAAAKRRHFCRSKVPMGVGHGIISWGSKQGQTEQSFLAEAEAELAIFGRSRSRISPKTYGVYILANFPIFWAKFFSVFFQLYISVFL